MAEQSEKSQKENAAWLHAVFKSLFGKEEYIAAGVAEYLARHRGILLEILAAMPDISDAVCGYHQRVKHC